MTVRKPPSEFTIKRGGLIRRAREQAGLSQALLADRLRLKSREIVSQYESGKIHDIGERTCKGLVTILGLRPEDLLEDPSMYQFSDELPTMSNEARRIARKWDALPSHLRELLVRTIDGYADGAESSHQKPPAGPVQVRKKK